MTLRDKAQEVRNRAERIDCLADIYAEVEDRMKWNGMEYHSPDDEHEEAWHSVPEEDSYYYPKYQAYQEVLKAIEKLADVK